MRRTTSVVILLPLVVLSTLSVDVSCADDDYFLPFEYENEVYSEQAKEVKEKILQQAYAKGTRFDEGAQALFKDNSLLDALQRYTTVYKSAEDTSCEKLKPSDIKYDIFNEIYECEIFLLDETRDYDDKLYNLDTQVNKIDESLKNIDETCHENANCADMKRTALEELNNIFSSDVQAAFARELSDIEEQYKVKLKNCFDDSVKKIRDYLDQATEITENCV